MRFVQARTNEFLVVGRQGRLKALGTGSSAFLWPGSTWVRVPASKQEACFGMTQESKDGIPLRFKGIAVYRIVDPVAAATSFDFTDGKGLERIGTVLSHVCLGELRDLVSRLSMAECIEQRKTTLTGAVARALGEVVEADGPDHAGRWGIAVDLLQVAQVFIVDDELRAKLEAELRNEISARSERSDIETREQLERARLESSRRLKDETLACARESHRVGREILRLDNELGRETAQGQATLDWANAQAGLQVEEQVALGRQALGRRVAEAELERDRETHAAELERAGMEQALLLERAERAAPVRQRTLELERATGDLAREVAQRARDLAALEAEAALAMDRVRLGLEARILPLRQVPEIAKALSGALRGADLTIYGAEHALAASLGPLVDRLARAVGVASAGDTSPAS